MHISTDTAELTKSLIKPGWGAESGGRMWGSGGERKQKETSDFRSNYAGENKDANMSKTKMEVMLTEHFKSQAVIGQIFQGMK